jgi:hypothetical protein
VLRTEDGGVNVEGVLKSLAGSSQIPLLSTNESEIYQIRGNR